MIQTLRIHPVLWRDFVSRVHRACNLPLLIVVVLIIHGMMTFAHTTSSQLRAYPFVAYSLAIGWWRLYRDSFKARRAFPVTDHDYRRFRWIVFFLIPAMLFVIAGASAMLMSIAFVGDNVSVARGFISTALSVGMLGMYVSIDFEAIDWKSPQPLLWNLVYILVLAVSIVGVPLNGQWGWIALAIAVIGITLGSIALVNVLLSPKRPLALRRRSLMPNLRGAPALLLRPLIVVVTQATVLLAFIHFVPSFFGWTMSYRTVLVVFIAMSWVQIVQSFSPLQLYFTLPISRARLTALLLVAATIPAGFLPLVVLSMGEISLQAYAWWIACMIALEAPLLIVAIKACKRLDALYVGWMFVAMVLHALFGTVAARMGNSVSVQVSAIVALTALVIGFMLTRRSLDRFAK